MNKKLCNFYQEVRHLKNGQAKVFSCDCRRHKGTDISVVMYDGVVREVRL